MKGTGFVVWAVDRLRFAWFHFRGLQLKVLCNRFLRRFLPLHYIDQQPHMPLLRLP